MKKKIKKTLIIISAVIGTILLISLAYFLMAGEKSESLLGINGFYDSNKNLINPSLSVIGSIEGVKYITLKITVNNKDTIPLTFDVLSITPLEIASVKPANSLNILAGKTDFWTTGLIDVEPYEGKTQEFCVNVTSQKRPSLRESSSVSGCISIKIDPNPSGSFDISLISSVGEGDINPGCSENWVCSDWSTCSVNVQTRVCTDSNNCETALNKPLESQACTLITECNSANVGIRKCYSPIKYQTCLASGSWSGILSCTNTCTGQGVCS